MLKIQPLFLMTIFLLVACSPASKDKVESTAPQCLKSQSKCFVETKFGRVEILFNQEKVLTEIPFKIYLKVAQINKAKEHVVKAEHEVNKLSYKISQVKSYMEGREMFMGKIPVFFSSSKQGKVMIAETLLGSCSAEKMVWRLWFTLFFENNNASISNIEDKESLQETFFIDFTSSRF